MNYIPFIPLFRFIRIIVKMEGLSAKGILHLLPWIIKLIVLEPFRLVEVLIFEQRIRKHTPNQSPIFILGHYRSGTTYLQRLFSFDTRFGHVSVVQHIAPELMLLYEKPLTKLIQWISDLFKAQNHFHRVPHDWSYPGEEDIALMGLTSKYSATWGLMFPQKFKKHFSDTTVLNIPFLNKKWEQDYRYLVNKISIKNQGKALVLKSPPNTARINKLKEIFPGAKFVFISRNPVELFSSMRRLWDVTVKYHALGSIKGIDIDDLVIQGLDILMNEYHEQKLSIPVNQLIEIDYDELVGKPVATLQKIYLQLDLPDFGFCKNAVTQFAKTQKSYERLTHKLPENIMYTISKKWNRYINEYEKVKINSVT